ncbi:hypothetical protein COO60DRAFT_1626549 [Scenedesmus sp. NREL 46B-D3]|nr:hypothetical protein COO60DRAFT_1626549 [Scenedesmus sp. NREL 46B-D3]
MARLVTQTWMQTWMQARARSAQKNSRKMKRRRRQVHWRMLQQLVRQMTACQTTTWGWTQAIPAAAAAAAMTTNPQAAVHLRLSRMTTRVMMQKGSKATGSSSPPHSWRAEVEADEAAARQAKKQRQEMRQRGHLKVPKKGADPAHDAREKQLQKLATRGVVLLFNAVNKAQKQKREAEASALLAVLHSAAQSMLCEKHWAPMRHVSRGSLHQLKGGCLDGAEMVQDKQCQLISSLIISLTKTYKHLRTVAAHGFRCGCSKLLLCHLPFCRLTRRAASNAEMSSTALSTVWQAGEARKVPVHCAAEHVTGCIELAGAHSSAIYHGRPCIWLLIEEVIGECMWLLHTVLLDCNACGSHLSTGCVIAVQDSAGLTSHACLGTALISPHTASTPVTVTLA